MASDEIGAPCPAPSSTDPDASQHVQHVATLVPPGNAELFPRSVYQDLGCDVAFATSITEMRTIVETGLVDVCILPLDLNGHSVLPLIHDLLKQNKDLPVIVVSRSDQINDAAEAMRLGAQDCIFVPFTQQRLKKTISNVLNSMTRRVLGPSIKTIPPQAPKSSAPMANGDAHPKHRPATSPVRHGMVLSDLSMKPVLRALDTTAASEAPIFIQGETGTGKELMARALHAESKRSAGPFVVLDCARLDPDTLEHQIFDTAKGAADPANGGTLFLDEIARMDPRVQARLIRFLKSRDIAPHVNGDTASVGVRLISASSENAHRKIQTGHFREDLYYRLCVVPITLPPLRERVDDIMAIANLRLVQLAAREGRRFRGFTPEAAQRLASYHWPGNVRQLINVVWNIVLNHDGDLVTTEMLPGDLLTGFRPPHDDVDPALSLANCGLLGRPLAEIERIVIEETIRAEGGSVPRAARVLNVSPSTIYRKRDGWARG